MEKKKNNENNCFNCSNAQKLDNGDILCNNSIIISKVKANVECHAHKSIRRYFKDSNNNESRETSYLFDDIPAMMPKELYKRLSPNCDDLIRDINKDKKNISQNVLFVNVFQDYQRTKTIKEKNEILGKLFVTKYDITICTDKILNYKIETYKKRYKNKLAESDINAICHMLIFEFLECPDKFIKKIDTESIFTTLTRAMVRMLDKEYENNVGTLKRKIADGKRKRINTIQYEKSFEIELSDKHDEVYEKTYFNDAAFQEWQKLDSTAETEEYKILKNIYNNQELFKNSPKQKEMFYLLAQGLNQKDIAGISNCSEGNIANQKKKLKKKISQQYGYDFENLKVSDIDFTELTKAIINVLPEMDENVIYRKDMNYFDELNKLLEYFEYEPEEINIQKLFLNKLDQSENIMDIILNGLIKIHKQLFINGILDKKGLTLDESLKLYWYITNIFNEYIQKVNLNQKLMNKYVAFREEYVDTKIDMKNLG